MNEELALKRSLTLPLVTFYGIGGIVGAGIYVLIGEVAGVSGNGIAMAFLLAGALSTRPGHLDFRRQLASG